ncbi:hypothetical protein AB0C69_16970 [Actinomadura sp. NPDC048032]
MSVEETADEFGRVVHRHLAHRPSGEAAEPRWRYSLMNRGHDPLK